MPAYFYYITDQKKVKGNLFVFSPAMPSRHVAGGRRKRIETRLEGIHGYGETGGSRGLRAFEKRRGSITLGKWGKNSGVWTDPASLL